MPKSERQKNPSNEDSAPESSDSVFDFLYSDTRRIASFLSQFDTYGHLTEVVRGETASKGKEEKGAIKASGGIPAITKVDGEHETSTSYEKQEDRRRTFDPTWINALNFLDHLTERDLLQREIQKAGIGQFILHSGPLKIHDLQWVEKMWRLPGVKAAMKLGAEPTGNRHEKRQQAKQPIKSNNELDMVFDMLTVLPHTIQAQVGNGFERVWCTLISDYLVTSTSDLTLKHGGEIPGDWTIVGVLDARPLSFLDQRNEAQSPDFTDGLEIGSKLVDILSPITRSMLGRPERAYGLTPLLIFREIGVPTTEDI